MILSNRATPKKLIVYVEELAWWNYGESVNLYYSGNTIFGKKNDVNATERRVCWYAVYLLWVWLTSFPGCSEKDQNNSHEITPKKIQEFKKRIAYLLPKFEIVTSKKDNSDIVA